MEAFRIEIAGVPVAVRCRFRVNQDFFHDYFTEKEPLFTIEPSAADLRRMQADFDRMDEAEGIPKQGRTETFLENNAIHSLLAERLVQENVLLMHGSALCMDGQAYIFIAKSGTGKSTHAWQWREVFGDRVWMINDDKPMLKISESGVTVYGTPWDGKHHLSRNASAPLKAIVKLERDTFNHIKPMQKADAFPMLLAQAFGFRNSAAMARMIELEKQLLNAVDFYSLGCTLEPDAAKVAWEGIQAGDP